MLIYQIIFLLALIYLYQQNYITYPIALVILLGIIFINFTETFQVPQLRPQNTLLWNPYLEMLFGSQLGQEPIYPPSVPNTVVRSRPIYQYTSPTSNDLMPKQDTVNPTSMVIQPTMSSPYTVNGTVPMAMPTLSTVPITPAVTNVRQNAVQAATAATIVRQNVVQPPIIGQNVTQPRIPVAGRQNEVKPVTPATIVRPNVTQPVASVASTNVAKSCNPKIDFSGMVPTQTTGLTQSEQESITAAHNKFRALHGLNPLQYDPTLGKSAQEWANQLAMQNCQLKHASNLSNQGENLAYYSGQRSNTLNPVESWYRERCDYERLGTYANPTTDNSPGHFTQVVWKDTTKLGCGYATCDGNKQVWVCRYSPAGNFVMRNQGETSEAARARSYREQVVPPV